jgi:uncharacterized membrane protein YbhN (UPF0104 family)
VSCLRSDLRGAGDAPARYDAILVSIPADAADRPGRRREIISAVVIGAVLVAAVIAVYRGRHSFVDALRTIGFGPILGSFALGLLGVGATYPLWRRVLIGLDVHLPWFAGARVFFVSQLGKYLPGSVWPVLIQMEAGKQHGASRRTMIAANVITVLLSTTCGLLIGCALLPWANGDALRRYWWLLLAVPVLLALLHPRAVPWLLDMIFGLLRRPPLGERVRGRDAVVATGWAVVSLVLYGLHVAVLAVALGAGGAGVVIAVGGMALATSAGVLFIPAPAGAGVRDVILALELRAVLTSGQALAVVVASRALLIFVDLVLAGVAGLGGVADRKRTRPIGAEVTAPPQAEQQRD